MTDQLIKEKVAQTVAILNELDVDMWMLVGREMGTLCDPSVPIVVGVSATWPSAFILTRSGEAHAIVGTGDVAQVEVGGIYTPHGYVKGWADPLKELIGRLDPRTIALNYSTDNDKADGLTHGMWLNLQRGTRRERRTRRASSPASQSPPACAGGNPPRSARGSNTPAQRPNASLPR